MPNITKCYNLVDRILQGIVFGYQLYTLSHNMWLQGSYCGNVMLTTNRTTLSWGDLTINSRGTVRTSTQNSLWKPNQQDNECQQFCSIRVDTLSISPPYEGQVLWPQQNGTNTVSPSNSERGKYQLPCCQTKASCIYYKRPPWTPADVK